LAQDRIEAPKLSVGDKWISTDGMTMEVIGKDENSYKIRFQNETIWLERSTLNRISPVQGKKPRAYKGAQRRLLNFPLTIGKSWKDNYMTQLKWEDERTELLAGHSMGDETQIFESYKVLGWEDVEVEAGHFRAMKIEYKREWSSPNTGPREGKAWYWYCPEVKNFIKLHYDRSQIWTQVHDTELQSFSLAELYH
jgi:hypothetical protein